MEQLTYKCPCCGAPLAFDSESQMLKCASCLNKYSPEQMEMLAKDNETNTRQDAFEWAECTNEEVGHTVTYTCPSCGGEIVGDENTVAAKCPYCDNPTVIADNAGGMLKPDYIIPFKLDKAAAKEALRNFYKGKRLLPKLFSDENHMEDITGLYVPFWLYDSDTDASCTFDGVRTSSWSDSNYIYTKTDHFLISREGSARFEKIPADGSKKMSDELMDSIEPFNYADCEAFNSAYLAGFLADKYDVSAQDNLPRTNTRIKNSITGLLENTVSGYGGVTLKNSSVNLRNGQYKYALMPVWILNTKWNGKLFTYAVNGQTGKIAGELPVDKKKYWGGLLGIAAALAAPVIAYLLCTM